MSKTIIKSGLFSALVLGLITVTNQVAFAATRATERCTDNGVEFDCAEFGSRAKGYLGWGIGGFVLIAVLGIWSIVFWIMMLVHAIKHDIKDKAVWIIVMLVSGIVGALIYYFAIKRNFSHQKSSSIKKSQ